jgi:hypothetical protein
MGITSSIIAGVQVISELYEVAAPLVKKLMASNSKAITSVKSADNSINSESDIANTVTHFLSIIQSAALTPKNSTVAIRDESIMLIRKVWQLIDKFTPDDVNVAEQLDDILTKLRDEYKNVTSDGKDGSKKDGKNEDAKILITAENIVRGIIKRNERGEFKGDVDAVIANVMQVMMDIIDLAQDIAKVHLRRRWTNRADAALDAFQAGCACFVYESSGRNLSYKTNGQSQSARDAASSAAYFSSNSKSARDRCC